ncbi:MAG: hypothetical protein V9G29_12905 [Burkholderiaceae bacterium]
MPVSQAIAQTAASGDPAAQAFFQALLDDAVRVAGDKVYRRARRQGQRGRVTVRQPRCPRVPRKSSTTIGCAANWIRRMASLKLLSADPAESTPGGARTARRR